jgi:hypothetical protein
VYVASIDNLKRPKGNAKSPFDVLEVLLDSWLECGLKMLVSEGPYHRARPFLYENPESRALIHRIIWSDLTTPLLEYSERLARYTPNTPWKYRPPLKVGDSESKWVNYMVDQAYPHVFALISRHLKRPCGVCLEIACPELSPMGMKMVRMRLGDEIGMGIGGKADGMIEGYKEMKRGEKPACVRFLI